jgi:hypothetical protein
MARLSVYVLFAALGGGACDPMDGGAAKSADKTATRTDTPAAPLAQPVQKSGDAAVPIVAASGDFTGCLLGCDAAKLSHADKATCRFNCEGPGKPAAAADPTVGADPVGFVVTCMDRCDRDGESSVACTGACKTAATGFPASPSGAVLDELGVCIDTCRAAKQVNATNHATCALNCAQAARVAGPARPSEVVAKAK